MVIKINDKVIKLKKECKDLTIIQLCNELNIFLLNFRYFEKLSIAGNCRMCLVEVMNYKNLVVACATLIYNKMVINTINTINTQ